jgi:hypothetical protein
MDDAVPDAEHLRALIGGSKPRTEGIESAASIVDFTTELLIHEGLCCVIPCDDSRGTANAFDLTPRCKTPPFLTGPLVNAELQT